MDSQTTTSTKIDVYEMVTNRMIELLEADTIPWKQPWIESGMPMNVMSKRQYRGINLWLLLSLKYDHHLYLTWDQVKALGGSINQGEHGHIVVFWKQTKKEPEELNEKGEPKTIRTLRYYKVFNVAQCRALPQSLQEQLSGTHNAVPIITCEEIANNMPSPPLIILQGKKAYYDVEKDQVVLPQLKSFKTSESYYSTLWHELVHSTGSPQRLGRKSITQMAEFGSDIYSVEELIAEIGASFLCSMTGILETEIKNSAAYIKGWLTQLKNDKKFIIQASSQAQRAVDFILNNHETHVKDEAGAMEESVVS